MEYVSKNTRFQIKNKSAIVVFYKLKILFLDILKPKSRRQNKKNRGVQDLNNTVVAKSINNIETQTSPPVQEPSDLHVVTDTSNNIMMLRSTESVEIPAVHTRQTELIQTDVEHLSPLLISPIPIEQEYVYGNTN